MFTRWTKVLTRELNININGQVIPTVKHPKVLGVTFDSLYMFVKHIEGIIKKVKARNRILKELTGTITGNDKEIILATYKALVAQKWITLSQYSLLLSAIHNGLNYCHHRTLLSKQLQGAM